MAKQPETKSGVQISPPKSRSATPKKDADIADEIERQIGPLVSNQQREQIVSRMVAVMQSEQFSGPIAHPKHLRAYEEILPGAAERIMAMAENQQNHNTDMEKKIIAAQISDQKRGMRYGLVALTLVIGLAAFAGMNGNNALAGMLISAGAAGVVGAFIKGRHDTSA